MEAFSANQKTAVSVRDSVGDEDDALGKAKAESVNVCFFYCGFIGHNQVLLKIADEHFLFPYPSYSPDIREGFTGNLEEKQNKTKKEESKKERVKVRNFSLEKRSVLFHKCMILPWTQGTNIIYKLIQIWYRLTQTSANLKRNFLQAIVH